MGNVAAWPAILLSRLLMEEGAPGPDTGSAPNPCLHVDDPGLAQRQSIGLRMSLKGLMSCSGLVRPSTPHCTLFTGISTSGLRRCSVGGGSQGVNQQSRLGGRLEISG